MKDSELVIGKTYKIIIDSRKVVCRLLSGDKTHGYLVENLSTGRNAKAGSASRFHGEIVPTGDVVWKGATPTEKPVNTMKPLTTYDIKRLPDNADGKKQFVVVRNGVEMPEKFTSAIRAFCKIEDERKASVSLSR